MVKIIRVKEVSKFSRSGRPILRDVSFSLRKGETLAVKGPSGCGKTTLAKVLTGLTNHDKGEILFFERPLKSWLKQSPSEFRQKVQLIFQQPYSAFHPNFPVLSYFEDTWKSHYGRISKRFRIELEDLFKNISLDPELLRAFPDNLSGGELQRIAILRALFLKPELIICDEITSNLDALNQGSIFNLLIKLKECYGTTLLIISHDFTLWPDFIDKVINMS